ncbi:MAG: DUF5110 domain-containing protein [Bdellovibrionales bacterium]|nr:DUF5110 domain-containing protein [Bdellovibrionales bacterium]
MKDSAWVRWGLGIGVFLTCVTLALVVSRKFPSKTRVQVEIPKTGERRLQLRAISPTVFAFEVLPESVAEPRLLDLKAEPVVGGQILEDGFETQALKVTVGSDLCMNVFDKIAGVALATLCPEAHDLNISAPTMTHAYGLGEHLTLKPEFNWVGKVRTPGSKYGNRMILFEKGAVGDAQFPVLYALGPAKQNFALVYDNPFAQTWDLQKLPWSVKTGQGSVRGYFIGGRDMPELRRQFMEMAGRPPVPPKKAFGLWMSEYGYDNWAELDKKRQSLKANGFPVEGFVLDLQWFGGIKGGSELSNMGGLQWDLKNFPEPEKKIAELREQGLGIIVIEEPFISAGVVDRESGRTVFGELEKKGFLVREGNAPDAKPVRIDPKAWWGNGGMLDFIRSEAGDFWHDWKRQPLINAGVMGHWTDLGEPEMFSDNGFYDNGRYSQAQAHNFYNLRWSESLFRGYQRNGVEQRPWILSRSGTISSQRFGVAMWSGDIGSNLESLESTVRAQGHMSLSGMDYFGSDTGGFHREGVRGKEGEMYTQWFVNSAMFDTPLRPHTLNLCNCRETAPDRVGHVPSNLAAARLRHTLQPYYYSLAHEAQRVGEPLVAPLVYYFQDDLGVRDLGDHKMVGPFLLAVSVASENITNRGVYFPVGQWYDYYDNTLYDSPGGWVGERVVRREGNLRLPLYARAGALIPTQNARGDIVIQVFPSPQESTFTLWEDDGRTQKYLKGERRATPLWQMESSNGTRVRVGKVEGSYMGAPSERSFGVEIFRATQPTVVQVNGEDWPLVPTDKKDFWSYQNGRVQVWLAERPVSQTEDILILNK